MEEGDIALGDVLPFSVVDNEELGSLLLGLPILDDNYRTREFDPLNFLGRTR